MFMESFNNMTIDSADEKKSFKDLSWIVQLSEHQFSEIIQLSPVAMVIFKGADHFISVANPAHDKLVGKCVQGKRLVEMFSENELSNSISILNSIYETDEAFEAKEILYKIINQQGITKSIFVNIGFFPLHDLQGNVTSILGVAQDVSELVSARNSAIIERDRMYSFFSQIPIMLNIHEGSEHIFTYVHH